MGQEIERKFLADKSIISMLQNGNCISIEQFYLAIDNDGKEVRIRKKGNQYFLTVKSGHGIQRAEWEVELTVEQYQGLKAAGKEKAIHKDRYLYHFEDRVLEIDIYKNKLQGLIVVEVEFESLKEAKEFEAPEWVLREITDEPRLTNQSIWAYASYEELSEDLAL